MGTVPLLSARLVSTPKSRSGTSALLFLALCASAANEAGQRGKKVGVDLRPPGPRKQDWIESARRSFLRRPRFHASEKTLRLRLPIGWRFTKTPNTLTALGNAETGLITSLSSVVCVLPGFYWDIQNDDE